MAEAIGAVRVEVSADTTKYTARMDEVVQSTKRVGSETSRVAEVSKSSALTMSQTWTTSLGQLGNSLKGAQGSIALTTNALNALGVQGTPAVNGIATSLVSLLTPGFTGLGAAIGLVTAGIVAFVGHQRDVAAEAAKATKALDEQKAAVDRIANAQLSLRAQSAGSPEEIQGLKERVEVLRKEYDAIVLRRTRIEAELAKLQTRVDAGGLEGGQRELYGQLIESRGRALDRLMTEYVENARKLDVAERELEVKSVKLEQSTRRLSESAKDLGRATDTLRSNDLGGAVDAIRGEDIRRLVPGPGFTMPSFDEIAAQSEANANRVGALSARARDMTLSNLGPGRIGAAEPVAAAARAARRELTAVEKLGVDVGRTLADGFADAFESAAKGAKGLADVLQDLGDSIMSMLLQFAARGLGGAALSQLGFGGETIRDIGFIAPKAAAAGAAGGSWLVGGSGATDSKYVGMQLSPGELVEVTPPGGRGGPEVAVTVINTTGQPARQERRRGSDGREEIRVLVGQAVAEDIATGGPAARALERHYGARRDPVRRG